MLNDTSVASAGSYIRTCRRIRNSKKIATIRDFHQNICVNPTISFKKPIVLKLWISIHLWGQNLDEMDDKKWMRGENEIEYHHYTMNKWVTHHDCL